MLHRSWLKAGWLLRLRLWHVRRAFSLITAIYTDWTIRTRGAIAAVVTAIVVATRVAIILALVATIETRLERTLATAIAILPRALLRTTFAAVGICIGV